MMSGESKNLCLKDRGSTCYFVMPLLVMMLFLPLPAMGKPLYLTGFVLGTLMDTFLDVQASKDVVIRSGISIFQRICHAPGTALAAIRYSMFSRRANQTRNSTSNGGCSYTAFSSCLSTNPGLDAIVEHVFGPQWLWMDFGE